MAKGKIKAAVDKVLHPSHIDPESDTAEERADFQEKYENQGDQASAPDPVQPKPQSKRGANPEADYQNHPKFAKFKKGN